MAKKHGSKKKGITRREFLATSGLVAAGLSAAGWADLVSAPYASRCGRTADPYRQY